MKFIWIVLLYSIPIIIITYVVVQGVNSKQLAVCQRMFVVVISTLPRRSYYSLVWRVLNLEFFEKIYLKGFQHANFFNLQTSEPYNSIGHTIDSKCLV